MIQKTITLHNGVTADFHTVNSFVFGEDGGCVATITSYLTLAEACIRSNPVATTSLRCDGVSPTIDTLTQIYGVMASDPLFSGFEALSIDSANGKESPITPLPEKAPQPSMWHAWDPVRWCWDLPPGALDKAKEAAKLRINIARNAAERSGFEAYGKTFDSDDDSIKRILSTSQAAAASKAAMVPLSVDWTCADNSTITLDADMLIALPLHMAMAGNAIHGRAKALKADIDAATTIEEIDAVVW